jgi:hypothetical protein
VTTITATGHELHTSVAPESAFCDGERPVRLMRTCHRLQTQPHHARWLTVEVQPLRSPPGIPALTIPSTTGVNAALLALAVLAASACTTIPPSDSDVALHAYLRTAEETIDACARPLRARAALPGTSKGGVASAASSSTCSAADHADVAVHFQDAARAARYQRGTTIYLKSHYRSLTALMTKVQIADSSARAPTSQLESDFESLAQDRKKLLSGSLGAHDHASQ